MPSTFSWRVRYGASPGTEVTVSYVHLFRTDEPPTSANDYIDPNKCLLIPSTGTAYSYERWIRGQWTGTYNSISNVIIFLSSGTVNTAHNWQLRGGVSSTYQTPVNSASTIATDPATNWDSLAEAKSLSFSGGYSSYFVMQASITSSTPENSYLFGVDAQGNPVLGTLQIRWVET